jgi:hypothetical protein
MFLGAVALVIVAVMGSKHHAHLERRRAEPRFVMAHELEIEPVTSVDSKVTAPRPVRVVAPPPIEPPDFRAAIARQLETLPICRRSGGPEGPGFADVTYLPNGTARVSLSSRYANSPVGACVARRFANAASPFEGEPVALKVRFEL